MRRLTGTFTLVALLLETTLAHAQSVAAFSEASGSTSVSSSAPPPPVKAVAPPQESEAARERSAPDVKPSQEGASPRVVVPPAIEVPPQVAEVSPAKEASPTFDPHVVGPVPESNPAYARKSLAQLESEREEVGLGMPITLLAIGAPLSLLGGVYMLAGLASRDSCAGTGCRSAADVAVLLGGVGLGVGVPLAVVGAIFLPKRIRERRAYGDEIDLRKRYYNLDTGALKLSPTLSPDGSFALGFSGSF